MVTSRVLGILECCKAEAYYIKTPPIGRCSGVLVLLKDSSWLDHHSQRLYNEHHNVYLVMVRSHTHSSDNLRRALKIIDFRFDHAALHSHVLLVQISSE
jgi:hypothetical protein